MVEFLIICCICVGAALAGTLLSLIIYSLATNVKSKKQYIEQQPVTALVSKPSVENAYYISNSQDWQIISWHAYDSIVIGGSVDYNSSNYAAITELIDRLPTLQHKRHPNERQDKTLKLDHNSAILVRNNKNGMELYIGKRDNVIKVGKSLTEKSFGRVVHVEDSTST